MINNNKNKKYDYNIKRTKNKNKKKDPRRHKQEQQFNRLTAIKTTESLIRNETNRGLMLGRYQPFHNGHLALAKEILRECQELIVVIGSAQFNYIEKDPFTAGERLSMIYRTFLDEKVDVTICYIVPIMNYTNNAGWLAYLKSMVPPFNVVYSGNDLVQYLAISQDKKIKIKAPEFVNKQDYNATNIRRLIVDGKPWRHLVPHAVAAVIDEIGGVERIKLLSRADSNPAQW